jgi:DNA-binding MarR family transcriptional regulator
MGPELSKAILALSDRMRLLRTIQEDKAPSDILTERDFMILNLLNERGKLNVSEIAAASWGVGYSTISTDITRLWRDKKLLTKTIDPDNQRVTIVELTEKGKKAVQTAKQQRSDRFQKLYEALNVTDEERKILLKIVTRAVEYFDELFGIDDTKKH